MLVIALLAAVGYTFLCRHHGSLAEADTAFLR
jgi:hypothetical protein